MAGPGEQLPRQQATNSPPPVESTTPASGNEPLDLGEDEIEEGNEDDEGENQGDETDGGEDGGGASQTAPAIDPAVVHRLIAENAFLKGRLEGVPTPRPRGPDDEEDDDDDEIDEGALAKAFEADTATAARTVAQLLRKQKETLTRKLTKRAGESATQASAVTQQHEEDRRTMYSQFPEISTDTEFRQLAEQVYQGLVELHGQRKPGMQTEAASIAYGQLQRRRTSKNGNGNGQKPSRTQSPMIANRQPPPAERRGDPLEGFSKAERASIIKACKQAGITVEQYAKNFANLQKEDSSYGK